MLIDPRHEKSQHSQKLEHDRFHGCYLLVCEMMAHQSLSVNTYQHNNKMVTLGNS